MNNIFTKLTGLLLAIFPLFCAAAVTPTASGGGSYFLALKSDGTVAAWGDNFYGELGDGTATQRMTPVTVLNLSGVVALGSGAGAVHSLAVKSDGSVWAWGDNSDGGLGDGTTTSRMTPVQVFNLGGVVAVAAGTHSLALKSNGTVWAWGANYTGNLGNGTTVSTNTIPVAVSNLNGITAITAGGNHSIALKNDGTVWTWGDNSYGQLGNGTTLQSNVPSVVSGLTGVVAIAAGLNHSLAIKSDGTVWAWGRNIYGQLGDSSTTNRSTPVKVAGLSGVTAITGGTSFSLALRHDSTVWGWGFNGTGQLGDGTTSNPRLSPVQIIGLNGVTSIASGGSTSVALKSDGSVWSWGYGGFGQLGDNTQSYRTSATQVVGQNAVGHLSLGGVASSSPIGFTATASGSAANLSLTANYAIASADVGQGGMIYLAATLGGSLYLNNGSNWAAYTGGVLPAYSSGVLSSRSIDILSNADVSALRGAQIIIGYGLSEPDMIQNAKYAVIYTIQ